MLDAILGSAMIWGAGGVIGLVLAYILKVIPNDKIQVKVGAVCEGGGVALTLGLSKWPYTKGLWNSVIEPWFVDAIDNIVVTGIGRFVRGMRSDN